MSEVIPVKVPKLTMQATGAMFMGWLVPDGARVAAEEPIYTLTTDKVDVDVEAPAAGVLRYGEAEEETEYDVGHQLGAIEKD